MRKPLMLLMVPVLAAGMLFAVAPTASATEGCILGPPGTPQPDPMTNVGGNSCTYLAAQDGGWVGGGDFTVVVTNPDGTVENFDETDTNADGVPGVSDTGQHIQIGDSVTATVTLGALAIGNAE